MNCFNKTKIAIFSDLHIGVHKNSKFWHEISKQWAEWFIADLKKNDITDIVFCGDFFHTRDEISVDTLHFGSDLLSLFSDFNLIMITGNHDCYLKDSSKINSMAPFKKWKNVTIVDSLLQKNSNGKTINFVPWGTELKNIPPADVIFGHFEITLFRMNSFVLCEEGFLAEELLEKSPLTFSGHFHLRDERSYNKGNIIYVGNPFQMDFNDAGAKKGYYILDLDSMKYEFVENKNSPNHNNITLSYLISEKTINDNVKNLVENHIVKLRIDRRISAEDAEFLINKLRVLKPIDFSVDYENTISEYDLDNVKKDFSGIDIEQAIIEFIDLMDINNKPDIIRYTLDLYNRALKE